MQLGRRVVCPDFVLVERGGASRVSVEIIGFWTEAYLRYKIAILRTLPPERPWILCVDETLAGDVAEALPDLPILRYRRHVDAAVLLAFIEGSAVHGNPCQRGS